MKKFPVLLALVSQPVVAFAEEAAGHHGGGIPWTEIVKQAVNFAILAVVLVYFLRKPLSTFLAERTELLKKAIEDAAKARAEAAARLSEAEARVAKLPSEIDAVNSRMDSEAAEETRRIREAAAAEIERIKVQAKQSAEQEVKKAREELRREAADLATQAAEQIVTKSVTPQDQERLVRENIEKIREIVR